MKQTIKNTIGCLITFVLTITLILHFGERLDPFLSNLGFVAIKAFYSIEDDSCDVMVYGSSHAWRGCDTGVMNNEYGIRAYNYACNWQAINTTLLFIEDSLRTQKPKIICIDTFQAHNVIEDTDMDGQIYYTRPMKNFKGKRDYLKQCFGNDVERYASYVFPLIMFHDNWDDIEEENYNEKDYRLLAANTGFWPNPNVDTYPAPDPDTFEQLELGEDAIKVLDRIVEICDKEDIKIIFFTCPWSGEYNYSNAMQEYADKNNCVYLDLFKYTDKMNFDTQTDLSDIEHLNTNGAGKVARFLAEYIKANYDL